MLVYNQKIKNCKMKTIKLLLLIFIVCGIEGLKAQDRNAIWLGGYGEPSTIWEIYDEMYGIDREMNGARVTTNVNYNDGDGISFATTNAKDLIIQKFTDPTLEINGVNNQVIPNFDPTRNMGIGHSLGGVVFRELDRRETDLANNNPQFERTISGYITVGSPNYGAGMADAAVNGNLQNVLTDGCERLAAGPISEIPVLGFVINGYTRNTLCDFLYDECLVNKLPNGQTLSDLRLAGDFMSHESIGPTNIPQGLNHFNSSLPRISIWGNENSPVHWRFASSFATDSADDLLIVNTTNQFRAGYNTFFIGNTSMSVTMATLGFFNPIAFVGVPILAHRAVQWKKGQDWFDNSESIWNALIVCQGSYTLNYHVYDNPVQNFCSGAQYGQQFFNCAAGVCSSVVLYEWASLANCISTTTYSETVNVNHPSDGFVCSYSQILNDIPQNNIYMAEGVNHQDQTDTRTGQNPSGTDVMRTIFDQIWNRGGNDFFHTD